MCSLLCDRDRVDGVQRYAALLSKVLSQYQWLTDAYVLDYFVENHWQKLPLSWQKVLRDIEPEELSVWLGTGVPARTDTVWPLSLITIARVAKLYTLRRSAIESPADIPIFSSEDRKEALDSAWDASDSDKPTGNLNHAFRKHVKPKKQHEISRLAKVVHLLARKSKCRHILDIGGGHGHLARLLALGYGLRVATVDAVSSHLVAASRFDDQAAIHVEKVERRGGDRICSGDASATGGLPKHITLELSRRTAARDLEEMARNTWGTDSEDGTFAMIGLHTCGDLGPSVLRLFAQTATCRAIALVGCCYMKMTDDGQELGAVDALPGLRSVRKPASVVQTSVSPLSEHVKSICRRGLSYEAREVACHALETYIEKLRESPKSLKIHCYRALLESIIVSLYPEHRHVALRSVKHAADMTFAQYASKALERFALKVPEEAISSPELEEDMKEWKHVIIFYSLRLLLAPLVESLVLTDRVLYLWEHGVSSCLIPLFAPELSPRNHVLLAVKHR